MVAQAFDGANAVGQALADIGDPRLAEGEYGLPRSESDDGFLKHNWHVQVDVYASQVKRTVKCDGALWSADPDPDQPDQAEVIWPTWPTSLSDESAIEESPLKDLQQRWDASINRLRDSAKWMATVLGATLVSVIPAASIADLSHQRLSWAAIACGLSGLVFLGFTLLLTLQVMRPQSLSYSDIEEAAKPDGLIKLESAVFRWQYKVQHNPDLYLPCGVNTLTALRQLMTVEEFTLKALSRARTNDAIVQKNLSDAQQARAARLHELHAAAAKIVTMGDYYKVRALSTWATCGGILFGLLGIVAIIAAVHWPTM